MSATNYKVFHWGNPVGKGATSPYHVAVLGVAKASNPNMPRTVANELICADLGRAIRLPIPPSFIVMKENVPYHVSLNFYLAGESLPDADPSAVAAAHPDLCCGIVLFDSWICNGDRNNGNIAFDAITSRVMLFDHSHAFMHGADWRPYLDKQRGTLNVHPLAAHMTSGAAFAHWNDRIAQVPEYFIREAVEHGADSGMSQDDKKFCADFLIERRDQLMDLVEATKANFPKIPAGSW